MQNLSHCVLKRLSHTIYWRSLISILGTSGYEIYIFLEKMKLFANSGDPDQMLRFTDEVKDLKVHMLDATSPSNINHLIISSTA